MKNKNGSSDGKAKWTLAVNPLQTTQNSMSAQNAKRLSLATYYNYAFVTWTKNESAIHVANKFAPGSGAAVAGCIGSYAPSIDVIAPCTAGTTQKKKCIHPNHLDPGVKTQKNQNNRRAS